MNLKRERPESLQKEQKQEEIVSKICLSSKI
jgi:hypothetical protein